MLSVRDEQQIMMNVDVQEEMIMTLQRLYHITTSVDVVFLGHEHGAMLCLAAVPAAAQSACHDALKVASFCTAFGGPSGACREATVA